MSVLTNKKMTIMQFFICKKPICMDMQYIDKVLPIMEIEPIPSAPHYLVGLMNLSGISIPVIDLALRLNMIRKNSYTTNHSILLCKNSNKKIGFLVDEVQDLIEICDDQIQLQDEFLNSGSDFLGSINLGVTKYLLLNTSKVIEILGNKQ